MISAGIGTQIATTAAGVMAGHAIMNAMGMGRSGSEGGVEGGSGEGVSSSGKFVDGQEQEQQEQMCSFEMQDFLACLNDNNENIGECQGYYSAFLSCQASSGLADAL
eukprot:TRINITY_DN1363_c0_g2_i2.p3 TRINITY_DN1363_c0_g2~~TRINITY_DN1363_c0_g2_i2.p3  ORF type:complete len:107 (+),score=35.41 TRINITY_DN1363_c0_g2_i2:442-762(+)